VKGRGERGRRSSRSPLGGALARYGIGVKPYPIKSYELPALAPRYKKTPPRAAFARGGVGGLSGLAVVSSGLARTIEGRSVRFAIL